MSEQPGQKKGNRSHGGVWETQVKILIKCRFLWSRQTNWENIKAPFDCTSNELLLCKDICEEGKEMKTQESGVVQ